MAGAPMGVWLRALVENDFAVDPPYFARAAAITLGSFFNTLGNWFEDWRYGRKIAETTVKQPLFVLGFWRSGTTHLHNLFCQDRRLAYPTFYQTLFPYTFMTTQRTSAWIWRRWMPATRPMDSVRIGVDEPQEDEIALCPMVARSMMMALVFPRSTERYFRYVTFERVPEAERREWAGALLWFLKKVAYAGGGRPLVLKSPGHTARVRMLLELFPDARFVHVRRNPHAVYSSMRHTIRKLTPWWTLQRHRFDDGALDERTITQYREVYDAFFEQRGLVPAGRLHELAYEDLERDPVGQMRAAYEALSLPDFGVMEPELRRYVDCLAGYRKNVFPQVPAAVRRRLAVEWRRCFEEWRYEP
jgi:hypothetical protein